MTSRMKSLLALPLVAALYFVHPALGFLGLAGGVAGVLCMGRAHDATATVAHEDGITNGVLS